MLEVGSKRGATCGKVTRRPGENGNGEATQRRRNLERERESELLAEDADDERPGPDSGVECPDDAAKGAGPALRIGVAQDEGGKRRVRRAHPDAEENRGEHHLPSLR